MNPITIAIRSIGERTLSRCQARINSQAHDVHLIEARPFSIAIRRTFEIAAKSPCEWTLAVDADVILEPDAVGRILDEARIGLALQPVKLFKMDFMVEDKFRDRVYAGCHLYRNKHAKAILDQTDFRHDPNERRPESAALASFKKRNLLSSRDSKTDSIGTHDHNQFFFHLYNKYLNRGVRDKHRLDKLTTHMDNKIENHPDDPDFKIVLRGLKDSVNLDTMLTDSSEYRSVDHVLAEMGLTEKEPM